MPLYDITHPLSAATAVWPGDTPYHYSLFWEHGKNASPVNVGAVSMSVHTGTHVDAPYHFRANGETIGQLDLSPFVGAALVVEMPRIPVLHWELFDDLNLYDFPRLLLKTGAWPDLSRFPDWVPALAPDVPEMLAERGVVLLGVDVPSVDALDSKDLPIHHALTDFDIRIVESLFLRDVPPDVYHLTALPLRLLGADGSPVRAILQSPEDIAG